MTAAIPKGARIRPLIAALLIALIVGAVILYLVLRPPAQAEVRSGVLPVMTTAYQADAYIDCSKVNDVSYDPHNPCQTFVLLESKHFSSSAELLDAEAQKLLHAGWRHTRQPVSVDWDAAGGTASLNESWIAPGNEACAYITTVDSGTAAEAKGLFPYDPYNQPPDVRAFYLRAKATIGTPALWVRLQPVVAQCELSRPTQPWDWAGATPAPSDRQFL